MCFLIGCKTKHPPWVPSHFFVIGVHIEDKSTLASGETANPLNDKGKGSSSTTNDAAAAVAPPQRSTVRPASSRGNISIAASDQYMQLNLQENHPLFRAVRENDTAKIGELIEKHNTTLLDTRGNPPPTPSRERTHSLASHNSMF
jgi:hypothetical protein